MNLALDSFRSLIRGKTRIALAWGFAGLLILAAQTPPKWPGLLLCLLGACLRVWASGHLRKDQRPAVGGPYAHVRNPLYLGTYLMALGILLAIESWALLAATTVLFAVIYHYIILDEEIKLRSIFGAPYELYCASVPRFFPRFSAPPAEQLGKVNATAHSQPYDWELAKKNKAYEPLLAFAGLWLIVWLIATFRHFVSL